MTLRDLGESSGIDFTYLSKIENDQVSVPSVDAIHRLARALKATPVEVARLIRTSDEKRESKVEVGTRPAPEEAALLLRRIYSGGYTRAQLRRMLQITETKERSAR